MLEIDIEVIKGIIFIHLEGNLNEWTIKDFEEEINYLLYKQGMHFFVFNFRDLNKIEGEGISWLQNKLVEIFLSCGNVVMCGLNDLCKRQIGMREKLYYVNNEIDAMKVLNI